MLKLYAFLFLLLIMTGINAQERMSCLPEGILFSTQAQIDSFQINYPGCTEIEGNVSINGSGITNLYGLDTLVSIHGRLWISGTSLNNLNGLENINYIGDTIRITYNTALTSLEGLSGLDTVQKGLYIYFNYALTTLTGLHNITTVGEDLNIYKNTSLTDLTGLENVTTVGDEFGVWKNDSLTSLEGLDNITSAGSITILENASLTSLAVLENINSLEGYLIIVNNDALTSLTGLENMTSVGSNFSISNNDAITSLMPLSNLTYIGGNLRIMRIPLLTDLTGLNNVTSIGALDILLNNSLTSLEGLDNIDASSLYFVTISGNHSLSTCHVQPICDYLVAPGGYPQIFDNADGCQSQEEVLDACSLNIDEIRGDKSKISIYPNPCANFTTIEYELEQEAFVTLTIFNSLGEKIVRLVSSPQLSGKHQVTLNSRGIPPGIYFYRLTAGHLSTTGKLVVVR